MMTMRQIRFSNRRSMLESRKVPLNTIILPPLVSPTDHDTPQIIGKVTVNKSKSNTVNGDIVIQRSSEVAPKPSESPTKNPESDRIAQLEQNIKFLQEQHQIMLNGLHGEIESLKNQNRDLQFQLVFVKGSLPSSPSSSEDDINHKIYQSPKSLNTTPLHVELMEKELGELKIHLQELESRNTYLSAMVDEQKKKLDRYERDREKERERLASSHHPDEQIELLHKLEDAEAVIRRLRREKSDFRRENNSSATSSHYHRDNSHYHHQKEHHNNGYQSPRSGHNQTNRSNNRGRNNAHYNNSRGWFPPLHSQSYWQGGRHSDRNGSKRNNTDENSTSNALPHLSSTNADASQHYNGKKNTENNNSYHHTNNGDSSRQYRNSSKNDKPT